MALTKEQKTKLIISLSLTFLSLLITLLLFYFAFIYFKIDTIYLFVFGVITVGATFYSIYTIIRNLSEGRDIYFGLEFTWQPKHLKMIFWFISPAIFFIFFYLYLIPVVFITWLLSLPFGGVSDRYSDFLRHDDFGICIIFGLFTIIWLWRLLKKNYFSKKN